MNLERVCFGCFAEKEPGLPCPYCGFNENDEQPYLALPLGSILNGRYLVGKVLGVGGFGITYLGFDLTLEIKIAIKEYMPSAMATRHHDHYSVVPTGKVEEDYQYGMERFLDEARILAKLQNTPHIVSVQNYFKENGTAYFVMEYIDGMSLKSYLAANGDRISYDQAITILQPIMEALSQVHSLNLLHRDISPDNIYITTKGESRLLDFGAARFAVGDGKSVSVILKHGYAPEEQYSSHGNQGPWTDVYAMGATFYRCITGQVPPDSVGRIQNDTLKSPSELGIRLPSHVENAIMKALSIKTEDRFSNMDAFISALGGHVSVQNQVAASINRRTQGAVAQGDAGQTAILEPTGTGKGGPGFFSKIITFFKEKPLIAGLSGGGILIVIALCIILPIVLSGRGDRNVIQTGGNGGTASVGGNPVTSGNQGGNNSSQGGGSNNGTANMVQKNLSSLNATIKIPANYAELQGGQAYGIESENRFVTIGYMYNIGSGGRPIYKVDDFESGKNDLLNAFKSSLTDGWSGHKIASSGMIKVGGVDAYQIRLEAESTSIGPVVQIVTACKVGDGAGCHLIQCSFCKKDKTAEAEMNSIIQSFTCTGKPDDGVKMWYSNNSGLQVAITNQYAAGGVHEVTILNANMQNGYELALLPEQTDTSMLNQKISPRVEVIKGSQLGKVSPSSAIDYLKANLNILVPNAQPLKTYNIHMGGVDWSCVDYDLTSAIGYKITYAAAMIDGECIVSDAIYNDSTNDAVVNLFGNVLSTVRSRS